MTVNTHLVRFNLQLHRVCQTFSAVVVLRHHHPGLPALSVPQMITMCVQVLLDPFSLFTFSALADKSKSGFYYWDVSKKCCA